MKHKLRPRTWIILGLAAVVTVVCALWQAYGVSDVVLPQADLQQRVDAKLPFVTKNGVTVSQAQVDLSGDKIGLTLTASATKLHVDYTLAASTRGVLRYDNARGAFFFHPEALNVIDVKVGAQSVEEKASTLFDKYVKSPRLQAGKEHLLAVAGELVQSSVQRGAEIALERVPVYTLPDNLKGHVARLALQSVEVKNGAVIAHLSFLHLTGMVLFYAFMFVLVVAASIGFVLAAASGVELPFFFL